MKLLAAIVIAFAFIALPAIAAEPDKLTDAQVHQMALEVCAGHAEGADCAQVRDFPGSDQCGITLNARAEYQQNDAQIYRGRFTADEPQVLVPYAYSDSCGSHANDGGGSILFRESGSRFELISYHPGMVFEDCVVASVPEQSRQHLFCRAYHVSTGEAASSFGEVDLLAETGEFTTWLGASSLSGSIGADVVPCNAKKPYLYAIDSIAIGTKPSEIVVVGEAYRPDAVAAACNRMAKKDLTNEERKIEGFLKDYGILRGKEAEGQEVLIRFELPNKTSRIQYTEAPAKP